MKTYLANFTYDKGNGYAIVNASKMSDIENILNAQGQWKNIKVTNIIESRLQLQDIGVNNVITSGTISSLFTNAYDLALLNGFKGSLEDWLLSLKGDKGEQGIQGEQGLKGDKGDTGEKGDKGEDGKSAYQIAVEEGFKGTQTEWIDNFTHDSKISTIYIDQTCDGTNNYNVQITGDIPTKRDAEGKIIRFQDLDNYDGNNGLEPVVASPSTNVISWIRKNTLIVHGVFKDGILFCSNVEYDDLDDDEAETFMKLPEFWYKVSPVYIENTPSNAIWKIQFTNDYSIADGTWQHWDGNTFIGCYKGYIECSEPTINSKSFNPYYKDGKALQDERDSSLSINSAFVGKRVYLHSIPETHPSTNLLCTLFRTAARNRGKGFSLVTYDSHKIMILLGLAYYGTVNVQAICGQWKNQEGNFITSYMYLMSNPRRDTCIEEQDLPNNTIFWGLQDWYSSTYEFVDDLLFKALGEDQGPYYTTSVFITEGNDDEHDIDSYKRVIQDVAMEDGGGILSLKLGKYFDVLPDENCPQASDYDYEEGWGNISTTLTDAGDNDIFVRAGNDYTTNITDLRLPNFSWSNICGSRLQYHGPWQLTEDIYSL